MSLDQAAARTVPADQPEPSALARLSAVDAAAFARDNWDRAPLLSRAADLPPGGPALLSPDDVDGLVADRGLRQPFFRLVSDGRTSGSCTRTAVAGSRTIHDLADADAVASAFATGATLVLQSVHRLWPPVGELCRRLAEELGHETQCNAYVTPAGRARGFDFHHDTHDVFVVQTHGRKHWQVHAPVLELPTRSQPRSGDGLVDPGRPPLLDVVLEPGDVLYLPRGHVHAADTDDVASVHLTIGVVATTWLDVLADAVGALGAEALPLRQALPMGPGTDHAGEAADALARARAWLDGLTPDDLTGLVRARRARSARPHPLRPMAQATAALALDADTLVAPRAGLAVRVETAGERVAVVAGRTRVELPSVAEQLVRRAVAAPATPASLVAGDAALDVGDALVVVRRLLREGVLVASPR